MKKLYKTQTALFLIALSLSFSAHTTTEQNKNSSANTNRILFLSCIDPDFPQPLWKEVNEAGADIVLLIGDNVYADSGDPEILKRNYDNLSAQPGFQQLKKSTPISGIWDDHDFGLNDGGSEHPGKDPAQKAFLDFFDIPEDSPRRQQQGVYHSLMLGEAGKRVQIIFLDTRYFRGPLNKNAAWLSYIYRYSPSTAENQIMLGETQWSWLEQQLREPAEVRIIVSSIQLAADNHGFERWDTLPRETQRMFDLIKNTKATGVLFISGDRHLGELMAISPKESGLTYPLYDLTSSSFNNSIANIFVLPTKRQIGKSVYTNNFGIIDIDWKDANPYIEMSLLGEKGTKYISQVLRLSDLQ